MNLFFKEGSRQHDRSLFVPAMREIFKHRQEQAQTRGGGTSVASQPAPVDTPKKDVFSKQKPPTAGGRFPVPAADGAAVFCRKKFLPKRAGWRWF